MISCYLGFRTLLTKNENWLVKAEKDNGSKTKVPYLRERLNEVWQQTDGIHKQMKDLSNRTFMDFQESEWIEDATFIVDACNSKKK